MFGVALSQDALDTNETLKLLQLGATKRGIEVWQAVVVSDFIVHILIRVGLLRRCGEVLGVSAKRFAGENHATATSGNDFVAIKA